MPSSTPKPRASAPGLAVPSNQGGLHGDWYREEIPGIHRLGIRVQRRLHGEQSPYQKIDVYESAFFGRFLTLDDLMMLTERDEFVYHEMLVHVPLCSLHAPRSVLVIGGGDLGCIREVLKHPTIERVVLCEIDERVTRVCEEWFEWVREVEKDPRVELVFDDGVAFIDERPGEFDLVVVDSTDPIGPAVGLFHREFYEKVRRSLRPGGILTAQTESPHWHGRMLGAVYGQLREVFARVSPYLGFIPTYPSGMWSWAFASDGADPLAHLDEARAAALSQDCLYYNAELHRAAFALPNFVRKAVEGDNVFAARDAAAHQDEK